MVVYNTIVSLEGVRFSILDMDPILNSTEVVAQVDEAGGLNSTENNFLSYLLCGRHYYYTIKLNYLNG